MSQVYCIRTRKKGKHLTFEEREELEAIVNKNNKLPKNKRLSKRQIARIMGVSPATIIREGSNEQVNGQLRRFIPKGSAIAEYSIEDILKIQEWINNYPRRVLNGKSSREVVEECKN